MTNTTVAIPDELLPPLQKYTSVKKEFANAMQSAQEMKTQARQAPSESDYEPITQLTDEGVPPAELLAAQRQLSQTLKEISEAQQSIELKEQEIERIKSSARMYTIVLIAIAVLVVVIAVIMIVNG